jgi:ribonucleotide reductase alpha subunit
LIAAKGNDTPETWKSIIENEGSVQHLDFLTPTQNGLVFKTAFELDQHWVVEHAAIRQPWICQGQSVNLFFNAPKKRRRCALRQSGALGRVEERAEVALLPAHPDASHALTPAN